MTKTEIYKGLAQLLYEGWSGKYERFEYLFGKPSHLKNQFTQDAKEEMGFAKC